MLSRKFSSLLIAPLLLLVLELGVVMPLNATDEEPVTVVTSTADSGPGSLRQALIQASSGMIITFDPSVFPPSNPSSIVVLSRLPEVSQDGVTVDASDAGVVLDGSHLPQGEVVDGLTLSSDGNTIRGLQLLRFPGSGLVIRSGAQDNTIGGDRTLGVGPTGQGNLLSENGEQGISLRGPLTSENLLIGNLIGTDVTGEAALGNMGHGIAIVEGAQHNSIGGTQLKDLNVISGNDGSGVHIHGQGTMYNIVRGNHIGIDVTGSSPIPNGNFGVDLGDTAKNNYIGGDRTGAGNIISGNRAGGVNVAGIGVDDNTISGNFIGLDASGSRIVSNGDVGVIISKGSGNLVGGDRPEERNVISGNLGGVNIAGSGAVSNVVAANYIGTDAAGTQALGNQLDGIWIGEYAQYNVVGGSQPGEGNLISGNGNNGVVIDGVGTTNNLVIGNFIGPDLTGMKPLGNENIGVVLAWGATNNRVGGETSGERNVISDNGNVGISIANPGTTSNTVAGNHIGTDLTGIRPLGNRGSGVDLNDGAQHNVIGGGSSSARNLISGNAGSGVGIGDSGTMWNVITGNYIGTDINGKEALGNDLHGVSIHDGAGSNTIGPRNIIAHNGRHGVDVQSAGSVGNSITANSIHNNGGIGIRNRAGGNKELSPPAISHTGTRVLQGTSSPSTNVEVFFVDDESVQTYQGTTEAEDTGEFVFVIPAGRSIGVHVTATSTDRNGNTSQFSPQQSPRSPVMTREIPGIVGPAQVSTKPEVVGTNLILALFCVLFFGATSTVFNSVLKDYRDELLGFLSKLIPKSTTDAISRTLPPLHEMWDRGRGWFLLIWLMVLLVTSLIESFLDPDLEVFSPERIGLLATLFVSALIVSGFELGLDVYAHRRWGPTSQPQTRVQWIGLIIAVGCVLLSRALDFKPGYLYGIVGAVYLLPELAGVSNCGRRAVFILLTLFLGGLVFWVTSGFIPPALVELEPILLTSFLMCLQGVFFALIPLDFTDGGAVWSWKRVIWIALFSVVFFCFYHFLLNPDASDVQALRQNGVQTLLILVGVYGLATFSLWILLPFRLGRRTSNIV
jgi:hypothetical protein